MPGRDKCEWNIWKEQVEQYNPAKCPNMIGPLYFPFIQMNVWGNEWISEIQMGGGWERKMASREK